MLDKSIIMGYINYIKDKQRLIIYVSIVNWQGYMEMTEDDIMRDILALKGLIARYDYAGRKVAFETAKIVKQLHPEISMPEFDKYLPFEEKAQEMRDRIDELEIEGMLLEKQSK